MQADCADKTAGRLEPPRVRPAVAMVPPPLRRHTRHSAGHSIATDPTLKQLTSHGVTLSPTPAAAEWRSEARRLKPPRAPFWLSQCRCQPAPDAGTVDNAADPDCRVASLAAYSCVALAGSSWAEKCSKAA